MKVCFYIYALRKIFSKLSAVAGFGDWRPGA